MATRRKKQSEQTAEREPLLVVLDSHGIIFRSYFALKDVITVRRTGEPVAAVFGYANSLLTVLNELKPTHVIAAWDASEETFRKQVDERYKANRDPIPEDLPPQIERVRELLAAFRIPLMEKPGFEADDVLGTLAKQAVAAGIETILITLDNDIVQLVEPGVRVYMYRPYQHDYVMYDEQAVRDRWGFEPRQIIDYKALVGDTSDNISGVKGIGDKGAKALIEQYGSVEEMLDHLDEIEPARTRKALEAGRDDAVLSKLLATIVLDVPGIELNLDDALLSDYDRPAVLDLFRELEFRTLANRLPESIFAGDDGDEAAAPAIGATTNIEIVTTMEQLEAAVAAVREAKRFAIHVIADDEHPIRAADSLAGIALSAGEQSAYYIPFGHREREGAQQTLDPDDPAAPEPIVQLDRAAVLEAIGELLVDEGLERLAHDGKRTLLSLGETEGGRWAHSIDFDTQVAAYLLGSSNMSLQRLAFDRAGIEIAETKSILGTGRKAIPFSQAPIDEVGTYAGSAANAVLRSAGRLREELERDELYSVFRDVDLPHIPVLARMEAYGVALDTDVLDRLDGELTEQIEQALLEVFDAVGHEFQIGSPKELSQVLFEEIGLPKTRKTKTGYTTDANALEPLRVAHPMVDGVLRWRELTKIKSTYVDTLPLQVNPRTGRVHTVFSQVTAATGRLSSNDPNLQNIPVRTEIGTEVRRAFVARDCGDDPILLSIDYSQIELRILAHMSGDEALRSAFDRGEDIHRTTAAKVFDVDPADVTPDQRRHAKVFNFGVLYGLTAFGMEQREGIPRAEGEAFIEAYYAAYPQVQQWREDVVAEAREKGYAETLIGRRRYIPDLNSHNHNQRQGAERIAINMPAQGTASDIIKLAMNRIDAELIEHRAQGGLARMLLQVHDELIFELPSAELDVVLEIARRLMPSIELIVPLELDVKSGPRWGDLE